MDFLGVKDRAQRFELINAVLPVAVVQEPPISKIERRALGSLAENGNTNNAMGQLFNPDGSGVDLQVDALFVTIETAGIFTLRTHDTALTTDSAEKAFRDRSVAGTPVGQVRHVDATLVGAIVGRLATVANEAFPLPVDFLLPPGTGILVALNTATIRLDMLWFWSEIER